MEATIEVTGLRRPGIIHLNDFSPGSFIRLADARHGAAAGWWLRGDST